MVGRSCLPFSPPLFTYIPTVSINKSTWFQYKSLCSDVLHSFTSVFTGQDNIDQAEVKDDAQTEDCGIALGETDKAMGRSDFEASFVGFPCLAMVPSGNDCYTSRTWSHGPVESSWVFPLEMVMKNIVFLEVYRWVFDIGFPTWTSYWTSYREHP